MAPRPAGARAFLARLHESNPDPEGRRWLYVPYDQLSDRIGPLSREAPEELGIILVESAWKAARRPCHRQKLALVLAAQRHFALEQAARGVRVHYVLTSGSYGPALAAALDGLEPGEPVRLMRPAERELRADLAALLKAGRLEEIPHEGWLTGRSLFEASQPSAPWRMDRFYRLARRERGILMRDGKPEGGKYSFDAENRKPWKGKPPAPAPPGFRPDEITREVGRLIEERFRSHPGELRLEALPASLDDVRRLWSWARRRCLPHFGPYEDAISSKSTGLFHTRLSPVMNLHRLLPAEAVRGALGLDIPLACKEGFVRQILGWREFVHHVHEATDGFRSLPGGARVPVASRPGDGGYRRWAGRAWRRGRGPRGDGGAAPSFLGAGEPVPPAFWGTPSGLACLDQVVASVWEEGYSHHITRLMILSNLATLLDVSPRELTDWFWSAYTDAYDWVVEPNVLGMGTYAAGDLMTTKPYVSGAAYIDRMSDHCGGCAFDPRKDCPVTSLYWSFLARHRRRLASNVRLRMPMSSLKKRAAGRRKEDARIRKAVLRALRAGKPVTPGSLR